MADNTSIAFGLKIDGVEQSIKSVKDLKSAIKSLQDEAEGADIGSEQYKNAIENIEKLNDVLKEVTQTEKQAAKAMEDMAEAQSEAVKETGDLRKQFEKLEDELFLLAGQGKQNTKEFRDLANEAAKLNKKIDDVNQSLGGSGAERAEAGFGKLGESLTKLDFKGVAQGAKMMGTALAATGVMLIVQAVTYLIANFDELSKGSGGLAKALRFVGDIIGDIIATGEQMLNFITDFIGLTTEAERKAGEAAEKLANSTYDSINKVSGALDNQTIAYDKQMAILKASGKDVSALEKEKLENIVKTNNAIVQQMSALDLSDEKNKQRLLAAAKAAYDASEQLKVNEAAAQKEREDKAAAAYAKALEKKKADDAIRLAESDAFWNAELALQEEYRKEEYILNKKAEDDQIAAEAAQMLRDENMYLWVAQKNREAREKKEADDKAAKDKELAELKALEDAKFDIIRGGLDNAQKVSDLFFEFKSKNLVKGSKEEEEVAKKQFQVNKAISLTLATNNGVEAVLNAFKSGQASPITPFFPAFPFVQASLAGVFAAANIAKIASSKFQPSGGGGGGGDVSAPMPSIPAPPTIATSSNNTNQSTTFDESGKNLEFKQPQINVTATVGVDEIASKSNRVSVLENQSTF